MSDTSGYCFLCLKIISSPLDSGKASLRCLSKWLDISQNEFCKIKTEVKGFTSISSDKQFAETSPKCQANQVDLCLSCDKLVKKFDQLYQLLEVTQLELDYYLLLIQNSIIVGDGSTSAGTGSLEGALDEFRKLVKSKSDSIISKPKRRLNTKLRPESKRMSESHDAIIAIQSIKKSEAPEKNNIPEDPRPAASSSDVPDSEETFGECLIPVTPAEPMEDTEVLILEQDPLEICEYKLYPKITLISSSPNVFNCPLPTSSTNSKVPKKTKMTVAKKYPCKICMKDFKHSHSLRSHHREVHLQEKPYACDICGMKFGRKHNMVMHRSGVHKYKPMPISVSLIGSAPSPPPTFSCPSPASIPLPLNVPTGELEMNEEPVAKKYTCEICGQDFKHRHTLDAHHREVHLQEKPYACDMCELKFSRKHTMILHRKSVHKLDNPVCEFCAAILPDEDAFFDHWKSCPLLEKKSGSEKQTLKLKAKPGAKLKCPLCDREFFQLESVKRHLRTLHYRRQRHESLPSNFIGKRKEKKPKAPKESTGAPKPPPPLLLQNATVLKLGVNLFRCYLCDEMYDSEKNLSIHREKAHYKGLYHCESKCKRSFTDYQQFANHKEGCRKGSQSQLSAEDDQSMEVAVDENNIAVNEDEMAEDNLFEEKYELLEAKMEDPLGDF